MVPFVFTVFGVLLFTSPLIHNQKDVAFLYGGFRLSIALLLRVMGHRAASVTLVSISNCSLFGASFLSFCTLKFPFPDNKWLSLSDCGKKNPKPDVAINSLISMCSIIGVNGKKTETHSNECK